MSEDTPVAKADVDAVAAEAAARVIPTDPAAIEDEIIATRARLARNVDALAEEANPASLAKKGAEGVRDFFVREDGSLKGDRVAKTAGAVVGFLVLRGIIRRGS